MAYFRSKKHIVRAAVATSVGAAALLAAAAAFGAGENNAGTPNFAPDFKVGWLAPDDDFISPESGPGPVVSDPGHPYISFYRHPRNANPTFRVADLNNEILQSWTKEALRKQNEKVLSGAVIAIPKERCWPAGVPGFLLYPATPVYFFQTPKEVLMVWMQDHQVRRVFLNARHSPNVKPSWFGESIGHYEGDTLVVDTTGISTKTFVDNYFTPHTEKLHVIERFRMIDDGQTLEVNVRVDDPGAFTKPWTALQRYRRVEQGPMVETVCAENNDDHFNHNIGPMPTAEKPDF